MTRSRAESDQTMRHRSGVSGHEACACVFLGDDTSRFDVCQTSVNVPQKVELLDQGLKTGDIHQNGCFLSSCVRTIGRLVSCTCRRRASPRSGSSVAGWMSSAMSNEIRGISTSVTSDDNASRPSLGEPAAFTLKRWFEEVYSAGIIPVLLIRWQLTGKDEEIRAIVAKE